MKTKRLILCTLHVALCTMLCAANPGAHSGYGDGRYMLAAQVEYDYNRTWSHYASFNVQAFMPVNQNVELEARVQAQTANVYTAAAVLRPCFDLPVGQLYAETEVLYKHVRRAQQHDLCGALSVGYRMDYVRVQVGYFARLMSPFAVEHHSASTYTTEVANVLYALEVSCRPQSSPWNLSAYMSNTDDYNLERHWQPLFGLRAHCDVGEHWRVTLDSQLKPEGIFHQTASFYGANLRAGFAYKF